jgi:hypothetical protein
MYVERILKMVYWIHINPTTAMEESKDANQQKGIWVFVRPSA